jgi:hypothetical protein
VDPGPFFYIHITVYFTSIIYFLANNYLLPQDTWWCGVDVGVLYMTAQLETPREGYNEHSSKSSLSCETKVY